MKNNERIAIRVSRDTIIGNFVLFAFKLTAGLLGHSAAMISDAAHSLSDVFSTVVVIIGVKQASKKEDERHPYGHERYESVSAIVLAGILLATGVGIGYGGVKTIYAGDYSSIIIPGKIALLAAIISIDLTCLSNSMAISWYDLPSK